MMVVNETIILSLFEHKSDGIKTNFTQGLCTYQSELDILPSGWQTVNIITDFLAARLQLLNNPLQNKRYTTGKNC